MKSWNKENRTKMKIWYSIDKYREADDMSSTIETIEGYQAYLNTPMAASYVNIEIDTGEIIAISRELVLKVHFYSMPKWTILDESHVAEAAEMRILNLENDIELQRNTFDQEKRMKELKDNDVQ